MESKEGKRLTPAMHGIRVMLYYTCHVGLSGISEGESVVLHNQSGGYIPERGDSY